MKNKDFKFNYSETAVENGDGEGLYYFEDGRLLSLNLEQMLELHKQLDPNREPERALRDRLDRFIFKFKIETGKRETARK